MVPKWSNGSAIVITQPNPPSYDAPEVGRDKGSHLSLGDVECPVQPWEQKRPRYKESMANDLLPKLSSLLSYKSQ